MIKEKKKDLKLEIEKLIRLKKEGVYWDYKEMHHDKTINLIHDITCLANAQHNSDRYIIFGVSDDGSVKELKKFKKQADIIDTLRNSKYADDIFPDIRLEDMMMDTKKIQILIIKNRPNKPYYFSSDIHVKDEDKSKLRAGTIYTRVMDTNTPKNRVASSKDIEYMWKERFGLIQTPLERMQIYLEKCEGWKFFDGIYFFEKHPEFTIKPIDKDDYNGNETREWARGEIGYHYEIGNGTYVFGLFYHTTLMDEVICVVFDGGKKNIVNPSCKPIGKGRIYYYLEDSLQYALHKFFVAGDDEDHSKNILSTNNTIFDIPLFSNRNELENFLSDIKKALERSNEDYIEPERNEEKQNKLFYSYIDFYEKWRKNEL
ncbi:MAG: ATP-binding protein [Sulfurovum sp.]|nr:ATP-binding protein [Sulfurovum sp.]